MAACTAPGKQAFATITEAVRAAELFAEGHGRLLWPYQDCPCRNWHLTSRPRSSSDLAALAATAEGTAALLELHRIQATLVDSRVPRPNAVRRT